MLDQCIQRERHPVLACNPCIFVFPFPSRDPDLGRDPGRGGSGSMSLDLAHRLCWRIVCVALSFVGSCARFRWWPNRPPRCSWLADFWYPLASFNAGGRCCCGPVFSACCVADHVLRGGHPDLHPAWHRRVLLVGSGFFYFRTWSLGPTSPACASA